MSIIVPDVVVGGGLKIHRPKNVLRLSYPCDGFFYFGAT